MESMQASQCFSRELIVWRLTATILWSIAVQFLFFVLILFVINFSLWHPLLWIQRSVSACLSFGTWLYLCPLAGVIVFQGVVCFKDYVMTKKYCGSRFGMFYNMFSIHNLIMCGLHVLIGGIITWIYLSLLGSSISRICGIEGKDTCLVEEHLFLLLSGLWIGVYFFIHNYIFDTNTLMFPVVHQLKFLRVKAELLPILKQAMLSAMAPTLYFFLIYFWKGESVRNYIANAFDYSLSGDLGFVLFNFSLLFYTWLSSTTFIVTMTTLKLLFQVYLTESISFPITNAFGNADNLTLHQALAMKERPIIQHLAFLDLKNMAEKDRRRRDELFMLSQPGGHPYNWNNVVVECVKLIKTFTDDLNKAAIDVSPQILPEIKELTTSREYFPMTSSFIASPSVCGMRNLSLRSPSASLYQDSNFGWSPQTSVAPLPTVGILRMHGSRMLDVICKKPGIAFLFGEIPDAKVRYLLSQSQPVIWAVQGLAHLTAASFKEDSYGVVQKDLPDIITTLLQLKQSVEKLQKTGNYKKSLRVEHYSMRQKAALRSAVKCSLYCICIAFGDYVKELPLTKEAMQQLHNFLMFREG